MTESQPISDRKAKTTGAETDACPAPADKNISGEHWLLSALWAQILTLAEH